MRGIAFYGKGGIGKSTLLSNVTAALSVRGRKILQIGCDPKHDSTRLILGGFTQATVLEQLNTTGHVSLDSVMLTGYNGIKCIESGGPEPGVGCAGRGIIQTLNLLRDQGLDTGQFDYVFFDVLGDVVCGGFAVPMREGYADEVYIVTSGEVASLYAANNIAKGLQRFSTSRGKLGGIIGNGRGTKNERDVVAAFARLIGAELVAFVPHSELIVEAEFDSKTIMDYAPNSELANVFRSLADHIERQPVPVVPKPLTDRELDDFLHEFCYNSKPANQAGTLPAQSSANNPQQRQTMAVSRSSASKEPAPSNSCSACPPSANNREPVQSCSLAGAFNVIRQIKDAVAIMHAPKGCSYFSYSGHPSRSSPLVPSGLYPPNLLCTNMQEADVVFGGTKNLKDAVLKVHKRFPSYAIFVINSCAAGIIGDDVCHAVEELKSDGVQVFFIPSDGVMNGGDFYAGLLNACKVVAESFIDEHVSAVDDTVNLIGEQNLSTIVDQNFVELSRIFQGLGIKVNCRFIRNTCLDAIKQFKKASVNIAAVDDPAVRTLTGFFKTRFNMETLEAPLPIGFEQTEAFVRVVGLRFDRVSEAEKLINDARISYERQLVPLREYFSGKKALLFSPPQNIDWLISTLADLEVEIPRVFLSSLFPPRGSFSTKYAGKVQIEPDYPIEKCKQAVLETNPDFVLTTGSTSAINDVPCTVFPAYPVYGFNSGLVYARRLFSKLKVPVMEGWRGDEHLFECFT